MESAKELQLIDQAVQKLLAEERNKKASGDSLLHDDNDQQLLSRLLSELESLKGSGTLDQYEPSAEAEVVKSPAVGATSEAVDGGSTEIGAEEIVKELKKVKKQNVITHCLLSAMIVLTVTWQLSEFSLILKVKDGLSHPFRSFGSTLIGMLQGPERSGEEKDGQEKAVLPVSGPAPPLKMPELPHMDFNSNGHKD